MPDITIKELMEAGVHFGHQTKRWNPKMKPYIFTSRNGIYIIDLQKTSDHLKRALAFARSLGAEGKNILLVGTKQHAREIIIDEASRASLPVVTERWLGGMMTNFETVKKSVARLKDLRTMSEDGTFEALSKKEVTQLSKELIKLEKNVGGVAEMTTTPDAMFIVDTKKEKIALAEARRLKIPVIAIVDTNCDPDGIEYLVPGNDDASRSIKLITKEVVDAYEAGLADFAEKKQAAAEERARVDAERKAAEAANREKVKAEKAAAEAAAKAAKAAKAAAAEAEAKPAEEAGGAAE